MAGESEVLQELQAREAIRDLVLRYCRAIDRKDYAALSALYHPDAIDDHGAMFKGLAGNFIAWLPEMLEAMEATVHSVSNHLIEISGDTAVGEVYCQAYHRYPGEEGMEELVVGGRYLDRYEQRQGEWRFSYRKIVADWNEIRPSRTDFTGPMFVGAATGADCLSDPSAAWFASDGGVSADH